MIADALEARLISGMSFYTVRSNLNAIRTFYTWADKENLTLDTNNLTRAFVAWTDYLISKQRTHNSIKRSTVFDISSKASAVLNEVVNSELGLLHLTRVRKLTAPNKPLGTSEEKQNLADPNGSRPCFTGYCIRVKC